MQKRTSGGSRLTEQNALTVMPWSRFLLSRVVTTVTPDAKRPSTDLKECWSTLIVGAARKGVAKRSVAEALRELERSRRRRPQAGPPCHAVPTAPAPHG